MKTKPKILIVGANFGGLSTVKNLPGNLDVTVVDPWPFFECLPNIHELVSQQKKTGQLQLSKKKIIEKAGHHYVMDKVTEWNPKDQTIRVHSGLKINYDYAVCAIGGRSNFFGVPGAEKKTFDFKSVKACHAIAMALSQNMKDQKTLSIVIVGGGLEGVEALGEILRLIERRSGVNIHVVDRQKHLLSFATPNLHFELVKKCRDLSVDFHMETAVKKVLKRRVELSNGKTITSDMVIWTGGVIPRQDLFEWGFSDSPDQWAAANERLQSTKHPNIFMVGDTAGLKIHVKKQAYHAMDMGKLAAQNITRLAKGKNVEEFIPSPKPTLITFGHLDTFMVTKAFTLAGPGLTFAKEGVYQAVMAGFDPGWRTEKAARLAFRLSKGMQKKAFPLLLSPRELIKQGNVRIIA